MRRELLINFHYLDEHMVSFYGAMSAKDTHVLYVRTNWQDIVWEGREALRTKEVCVALLVSDAS